MNRKIFTKRFTALLLTMTMVLGTIMPSFANEQKFEQHESTVTEYRINLTEEELIEIIENTEDIEIIREINNVELDSIPTYRMASMTGTLDGTYELYIIGLGVVVITMYNNTIKMGNKIISVTSSIGKKITKAVDNFVFAQKNPTGRTARDVEKRLKKEGFEKVKSNGGSHQQWKKGSRKVTVPKHGGRDIDIKTLRSIWKQAGWL